MSNGANYHEPVFHGTELVAVLMVPRLESGRVRLLTAELYEDGVILRYVVPDSAMHHDDPIDQWDTSLALTDDLGTDYEWQGGAGGANDGMPLRGEVQFSPAVPMAARTLIVTTDDGTVELPIPR